MSLPHARSLAPQEDVELREWLESLDFVLQERGSERAEEILRRLRQHARQAGVSLSFTANTPYVNTIPASEQPPYPGSQEIERRIKSFARWNALAMVVRANRLESGIGGHISTYGSAATLYEVGFNHFFRARNETSEGDIVYFQGHASPGIYARAYLEGRISVDQLENFRRELKPGGGLSSYPHPWLMPDFWEFPTVSMGLGPIMSIYQARFNRYLEDRGLKERSDNKVWAFIGDGETDEPESLGAITLASREQLNNLIWVINCNLQRLDGPVRGNGKIVQELEAIFRGAGWNVIKVLWGSDWDALLEKDAEGLLVKRMGEVVDGQYQKNSVESGGYFREHFFGVDPRLLVCIGFLGTSFSLHRFTNINLQIDFVTAMSLRMVQVLFMPLIFVPISTLNYIGVPREKNNQVSGMSSFARNLGGSIGTSLLGTFLTRQNQTHQVSLVAHATHGNINFERFISGLKAMFIAQGYDAVTATTKALAMAYRTIQLQAGTLSFVNSFHVMSLIVLCLAPLPFVMRRPKLRGGRPRE